MLKKILLPGEYVVKDRGYRDNMCKCSCKNESSDIFSMVRARHETVNRGLKKFGVLGDRFRHSIGKHSMCVHAVGYLVQLSINYGNSLFST